MPESQEKIKEFWEAKSEKIATKIEKTPMERFFVFFLIVISFSAIVLGYFQLRQNIKGPLYSSILYEERAKLREQYKVDNTNTSGQADITRLQNQDSDLDGLSDYSEIYLYKTSAYLEDSDSDGIWDKQEILAGTNPNCAEGQNCDITIPQEQPIQDVGSDYIIPNIGQGIANGFDLSNLDDVVAIEEQLLSGELDLADLGIDDPGMQDILEQLRGSEIGGQEQLSGEEMGEAMKSLEQLTPDQIRQELQSRGIGAASLEQISDEQLMEIFKSTLNLYQ